MAVDDSQVVDFVSVDSRTGRAFLTISDHSDWSDSIDPCAILQRKFNAYLAFAESGELINRFPKTKGLPIVIDVRFFHEPDAEGIEFLAHAREVIELAGYSLNYKTHGSPHLN